LSFSAASSADASASNPLRDVDRQHDARLAPLEIDHVRDDVDEDRRAVLEAMPPRPRFVVTLADARQGLAQRLQVLGQPQIGDRQRQELVADRTRT
jgi:hypothetical protein